MVRFAYDGVEGEVEIVKYNKPSQTIEILYNNKTYKSITGNFCKGNLRNIVLNRSTKLLDGTNIEDLRGMKFGKLTVVEFDKNRYGEILNAYRDGKRKGVVGYWVCLCECGKYLSIDGASIKSGGSTSCGICYTFEDWCLDNNHQDYLDLWDYDLNDKKPSEIGYRSGKKSYFKCPRGIHESDVWMISGLTSINKKSGNTNSSVSCRKCGSFGQYLIDTYGENGISIYWSDKNVISPYDISKGYNGCVWIKCVNGHNDYKTKANGFYSGNRCAVCCGQKIERGVNDIATTDPWISEYVVNKEDMYCHSRGSSKKILVRCRDCKTTKLIAVSTLILYGLGCKCGDGQSYPNKFIYSVLNQLSVTYKAESVFDWGKTKKYDIYIPSLDIIVENHGIQHYVGGFETYGGRDAEEESTNDVFKKDIALKNGINHYIEIDCRYSEIEWIKNSIMNSELPSLLNFKEEDIDWAECDKYATKNLVKEVCELWSAKKYRSALELSSTLNISNVTVGKYLKKGSTFGWCSYSAKKAMERSGKKRGENNGRHVDVYRDGKLIHKSKSVSELARTSEGIFGVKLCVSSISNVCLEKRKEYKGYTFKYAE